MAQLQSSQLSIARPLRRNRVLFLATVVALLFACIAFSSARAADYMALLDTYWDVHDQVLFPTNSGRHYIDLFWTYSPELWQIAVADPALIDESTAIILQFEPPLRALVDGEGSTVVITDSMVRRVESFLGALEERGSPALRITIQTERARNPLDRLIGLTFEEARLLLVGPPVPSLSEPLPTRFP